MKKQDIRMIDVTQKKETERVAIAKGRIRMTKSTLELIKNNQVPKGDVLVAAQIAGIMAAKRTPDTIPLCHPLLLTGVQVDFSFPKAEPVLILRHRLMALGKPVLRWKLSMLWQ